MAANKMAFYEHFNDAADEFFKDLIRSFPEVTEFQRFKSAMTMLRNLDPKMPRNLFVDYFLFKYRDAVLKKDETVFLEEQNYEIVSQRKEYWNDFINHIKGVWKTLDEDSKKVIWKYFHVLIILSDKCA